MKLLRKILAVPLYLLSYIISLLASAVRALKYYPYLIGVVGFAIIALCNGGLELIAYGGWLERIKELFALLLLALVNVYFYLALLTIGLVIFLGIVAAAVTSAGLEMASCFVDGLAQKIRHMARKVSSDDVFAQKWLVYTVHFLKWISIGLCFSALLIVWCIQFPNITGKSFLHFFCRMRYRHIIYNLLIYISFSCVPAWFFCQMFSDFLNKLEHNQLR